MQLRTPHRRVTIRHIRHPPPPPRSCDPSGALTCVGSGRRRLEVASHARPCSHATACLLSRSASHDSTCAARHVTCDLLRWSEQNSCPPCTLTTTEGTDTTLLSSAKINQSGPSAQPEILHRRASAAWYAKYGRGSFVLTPAEDKVGSGAYARRCSLAHMPCESWLLTNLICTSEVIVHCCDG